MKSIDITKLIFIPLLFIVIACNSNSKNSQESEAVLSNTRYAGKYSFGSEEEDSFGNVSIRHVTGNIISFELYIEMGGNSGELSGEMEIEDSKGVFKNDEYGDCILDFVFTDNSVKISHQEGGYECGFGMNVYVNNTFVKKPTDESLLINEDMLWKIFLKIPEDSIPEYLFRTIPERKQARINELFNTEYEEEENNYLRYDVTNDEGIRIFMGIVCYPADDEKKIITLFYHGGGIDVYQTLSNQTYEYDIAKGELKAIERPIDPYTEDEFLDESSLTSKQKSEMRKLFSDKSLFNYVDIDRIGFSVYFSAFGAFDDDWEKYGEYVGNNQVRRNWDGKRFVKAE